jgi:dihydroorotase
MNKPYELVLTGATVLDPSQGLEGSYDVAFKDGLVASIAPSIPNENAERTIDVTGCWVVPGLIDIHGHYAYKISAYKANPDDVCLPVGVTTAVDTGSTGWMNFPGFRSYVMERVDTRLYAFLHLSSLGTMPVALQVPDLEDFRFARVKETIQCIEENSDLVVGVKVRLSPNGTTAANAVPALKMAREIADETQTKVMVHVMESPIPMSQVLEHLLPGDIITHCFHGDTNNILDGSGAISREVWEAYRNGIIFDTACFVRHFSIPICKKAIGEGLLPHTLSTDRVGDGWPFAPKNYNMLEVMTMFLAFGMSMEEVIRSSTVNAATAIQHPELGTLKEGAIGDAAVLRLEEGSFHYDDLLGNEIVTSRRFAHVLTVKCGRVWSADP